MRTNLIVGLAGALVLGASTTASAIPIRVTAGGAFGEIENEQLVIEPATAWSIDLTYESTTPDARAANPFEGFYGGFQNLELTIGAQSYALGDLSADGAGIVVFNDRQSLSGRFIDSISFEGAIAGTTLGFRLRTVYASETAGAGPFQSDALIADPTQLESVFVWLPDPALQFMDLLFYDLPPGQTITNRFATATVDRFSASLVNVPEPGTLGLFAPALLLLVRASRRRLKRSS